jgi:glycosyltransferase involved in cell wall biosynthesis
MSAKPKLLFLATESWFVKSHFMPLVRRAVADGYAVTIAARMDQTAEDLKQTGARVIDLGHERGDIGPIALFNARSRIAGILKREQPDILHVFALKSIFLACLSTHVARRTKTFLAFTGLGFLATAKGPKADIARGILARIVSRRVRDGAHLIVENEDDRAWLERLGSLPDHSVVLLPGAGVEPDLYAPKPEPAGPLRIGLVARLVRSKGVDVAVTALAELRKSLPDAELCIAGDPDFHNPASFTPDEIEVWRKTPGVKLYGRVTDVPAFWAQMQVACLPSRGGEGLPRSLIEASACGRPVVTTDVPGCRQFVVAGETGFVCPPGDAPALAEAFLRLRDGDLRRRLGAAGRARVLADYTVDHVADLVSTAWKDALAARASERA